MNRHFDKFDSGVAMSRNVISMRGKINQYLRWNLSLFPIEKNKRILDLGCGPGIYFHEIIRYSPAFYVAADYSADYTKQLKKLFDGNLNCETLHLDLMDPSITKILGGYKFDYVFLFDVLEHIEDDKRALENIYNILEICGATYLFLRVPAIQAIYGENDKAIGHHRRYSAKSLKMLLESCLFHVKFIRYQNFIGIIPWFLIGNIFKRNLAVSNSEATIFNSMVPLVSSIERLLLPPLGLSLYCVCVIKSKRLRNETLID